VRLPDEFWELQELVQAGCPEEALKAFRAALLKAKPKRIDATMCDAAIGGARSAMRTGPIRDKRKKLRETRPEKLGGKLARLRWYASAGVPVVFARPAGYVYTHEEMMLIQEAEKATPQVGITHLEFWAEGVDRIAGPSRTEWDEP
jgi:hypothetical protein